MYQVHRKRLVKQEWLSCILSYHSQTGPQQQQQSTPQDGELTYGYRSGDVMFSMPGSDELTHPSLTSLGNTITSHTRLPGRGQQTGENTNRQAIGQRGRN
ncbi:unnamed protein product [Arctogadus glacialis]